MHFLGVYGVGWSSAQDGADCSTLVNAGDRCLVGSRCGCHKAWFMLLLVLAGEMEERRGTEPGRGFGAAHAAAGRGVDKLFISVRNCGCSRGLRAPDIGCLTKITYM